MLLDMPTICPRPKDGNTWTRLKANRARGIIPSTGAAEEEEEAAAEAAAEEEEASMGLDAGNWDCVDRCVCVWVNRHSSASSGSTPKSDGRDIRGRVEAG